MTDQQIDWTPHYVEVRYDKGQSSRSWVTRVMTREDFQIGNSVYSGSKREAMLEASKHNLPLKAKGKLMLVFQGPILKRRSL